VNPATLVLVGLSVAGGAFLFLKSQGLLAMFNLAEAEKRLIDTIMGLGIDFDVVRAVMLVESGGRRPKNGDKLIIRFEPATFYAKTGKTILLPGMPNVYSGRLRRGGQGDEWAALAKAVAINAEKAYQSISMGVFQVMGFNYAPSGYHSATAMFKAFMADQTAQYTSFAPFLMKYQGGILIPAMRNLDWTTFGLHYNGVASAGARYQAAYNTVRRIA
jgi:hypothetical protein